MFFRKKTPDEKLLERLEKARKEALEALEEIDKKMGELSSLYEQKRKEIIDLSLELRGSLRDVKSSAVESIWKAHDEATAEYLGHAKKELNRIYAKIMKDATEADRGLVTARREVEALRARIHELQKDITKLRREVDSLGVKITSNSQNTGLEHKLDSIASRQKKLEARLRELEKENKSLKDENRELREFVEASLREMRELKRQIEALGP